MLAVDAISKTFPGQRALQDVHLEIRAGEVCALVGQNGSGKSTLIKILAGYHEADPGGVVTYRGRTSSLHEHHGEAAEWRSHVRFIHQDLGLVETLSTLDNLAMGRGFETGFAGRILWKREAERARGMLADLDMHFDVRVPVAELSGVERTMVAVVRALMDFDGDHGILVLDEPTAALSGPDVQRLFAVVRRLAERGAGILFVSHRLDDIFDLADRVVVLREGRVVADHSIAELDHDRLIELIVGRAIDALYPELPDTGDEVILSVRGLHGTRIEGLDLEVRAGEILGITGLNGSGREELAGLLFGAQDRARGDVLVRGEEVRPGRPRAALDRGITLVPADRARHGVIGAHSVRENVSLPQLGTVTRRGRIEPSAEHKDVLDWSRRVGLAPLEIERPVLEFSGGNQQKIVLAKCLRRAPRVVLLDEPTQGVDVGAKAAIYELIAQAAREGAAVVVCSSDLEEVAHLADRALAIVDGRVVDELSGSNLSVDRLTAATLRPTGSRA